MPTILTWLCGIRIFKVKFLILFLLSFSCFADLPKYQFLEWQQPEQFENGEAINYDCDKDSAGNLLKFNCLKEYEVFYSYTPHPLESDYKVLTVPKVCTRVVLPAVVDVTGATYMQGHVVAVSEHDLNSTSYKSAPSAEAIYQPPVTLDRQIFNICREKAKKCSSLRQVLANGNVILTLTISP